MQMLRSVRALPVLVLFLGMAGCAPADPAARPEAGESAVAPQGGLAASLQAESYGDSVRFSLRATNVTDAPIPLTFPTGQSFDFIVESAGRQVWRWSDEMMFTQAIRQEVLAPGETREYTATWSAPSGTRGEFTVTGYLATADRRAEQRTQFRLP
jgi:hypothetical protein